MGEPGLSFPWRLTLRNRLAATLSRTMYEPAEMHG
jgi:hypothetical protein